MTSLLTILLLAAVPTIETSPIVIGEQMQIVQGEQTRMVNVVLPASFETSPKRTFPIVILLDGGVRQWLLDAVSAFSRTARRGQSEEVILVGIETRGSRRHDLTPPMRPALEDDDEHRGGGGAAGFRLWLAEQVVPAVSSRFRGDGRVFLVGHSLGGLFVIETLLSDEFAVDGVAAISPSLWWDENAPLNRATSVLPKRKDLPPIFLTRADEDPDLMRSVEELRSSLAGHDRLCYEERPEQSHGTVVPAVLLQVGPCLWPSVE